MALKSDEKRYIPIMKARPGELDGLSKLSDDQWGAITPLIEIPPVPSAYLGTIGVATPGKSIATHVAKVNADIAKSLPANSRYFVDGCHVENESALPDKQEPIAAVLSALRSKGFASVPVVGLGRVLEYLAAVKAAHAIDRRGYCLRVTDSDLASPNFSKRVTDLLKYLNVAPRAVDLILDYGGIADPESAAELAKRTPGWVATLPNLAEWRTVTLAATGMPKSLASVKADSTKLLARHEWSLWLAMLRRKPALARHLNFGDYVTSFPKPDEVDPRILNKAPSIKYTTANSWFVAKGKAKPKKATSTVPPQDVQYPNLAKQVMDSAYWQEEAFSWGDDRIGECYRKRLSKKKATGGSGTWITVAVTHHIATVVDQLANLP